MWRLNDKPGLWFSLHPNVDILKMKIPKDVFFVAASQDIFDHNYSFTSFTMVGIKRFPLLKYVIGNKHSFRSLRLTSDSPKKWWILFRYGWKLIGFLTHVSLEQGLNVFLQNLNLWFLLEFEKLFRKTLSLYPSVESCLIVFVRKSF